MLIIFIFLVYNLQIPIAEKSLEAGMGLFLRDDGKEMPDAIITETETQLGKIAEGLGAIAGDPKKMPESVGHYYEQEFNKWIEVITTYCTATVYLLSLNEILILGKEGRRRRSGCLGLAKTVF